jgi:hypothetical protein
MPWESWDDMSKLPVKSGLAFLQYSDDGGR